MNLAGIFGHILGATSLFLFTIIDHPVVPTPTPVPLQVLNTSYVATKSYTYDGSTTSITVYIPKNGGEVTGNISGACDGSVTGLYSGTEDGKISGEAHATCHIFVVSIPVAGTYSGFVDKKNKSADLTVDVKVNGFEQSQSVVLPLK